MRRKRYAYRDGGEKIKVLFENNGLVFFEMANDKDGAVDNIPKNLFEKTFKPVSSKKKTRAELINAGKIWNVTQKDTNKKAFEGTKTACLNYLRKHGLMRDYRRGQTVRLCRIIWEEGM